MCANNILHATYNMQHHTYAHTMQDTHASGTHMHTVHINVLHANTWHVHTATLHRHITHIKQAHVRHTAINMHALHTCRHSTQTHYTYRRHIHTYAYAHITHSHRDINLPPHPDTVHTQHEDVSEEEKPSRWLTFRGGQAVGRLPHTAPPLWAEPACCRLPSGARLPVSGWDSEGRTPPGTASLQERRGGQRGPPGTDQPGTAVRRDQRGWTKRPGDSAAPIPARGQPEAGLLTSLETQ